MGGRPDAAIDCFYVYPTVSTDPGEDSDMTPDPAERNVDRSAVRPVRLGVPAVRAAVPAGDARRSPQAPERSRSSTSDIGLAYDDVRDAWRDYLKRDNRGRGVVLIGHSQGSFILIELLRQEIEGTPVQKQIVSAILMGTTVSAPKGRATGRHVQVAGAVRLGRRPRAASSRSRRIARRCRRLPTRCFGHATEPDQVALCTNPVTFNERSGELHAYLSAAGGTIITQQAQAPWADGQDASTRLGSACRVC